MFSMATFMVILNWLVTVVVGICIVGAFIYLRKIYILLRDQGEKNKTE